MILVIAEQRDGSLNRASWEIVAAAQQMGGPVKVAIAGAGIQAVATELALADVAEVIALDHPALGGYTPDGFVQAFAHLVREQSPDYVLLAHTYQTRDFAPKLAARLDRGLITDCVGVRRRDGRTAFVRPMFQGKFVADVVPRGSPPFFVSFQIGTYRADGIARGPQSALMRIMDLSIDESAVRQQPEAPFREAKQAVDLTQASRIVAVGRGIKAQEHLALAERLATALDAELAASRPICDSGWLPMDRQIGSSGQTVSPKLYLALGISGAIQHLVGMKGARTIVAINKDREAPIFEVADYGIVGDLFEIVPALLAELGSAPPAPAAAAER